MCTRAAINRCSLHFGFVSLDLQIFLLEGNPEYGGLPALPGPAFHQRPRADLWYGACIVIRSFDTSILLYRRSLCQGHESTDEAARAVGTGGSTDVLRRMWGKGGVLVCSLCLALPYFMSLRCIFRSGRGAYAHAKFCAGCWTSWKQPERSSVCFS